MPLYVLTRTGCTIYSATSLTFEPCEVFVAARELPNVAYVADHTARAWSLTLLRELDRLADVAFDAGFCDQSHFTNAFRRVFGVTPAAWRQSARGY